VTNEDSVFFYDRRHRILAKQLDRLWADWLRNGTAARRSWPPRGAKISSPNGSRRHRQPPRIWELNKVKPEDARPRTN
jgi:hypothetical protein